MNLKYICPHDFIQIFLNQISLKELNNCDIYSLWLKYIDCTASHIYIPNNITEKNFTYMANKFKQLKHFKIMLHQIHNTNQFNFNFGQFNFNQLISLEICIYHPTNIHFDNILQHSKHLQELTICGVNIDKNDLRMLHVNSPEINKLTIISPHLNDDHVYASIQHLRKITYLNVSTSRITHGGIKLIVDKCKCLNKFFVNFCKHIFDKSITYIINNSPKLKLLDITGTNLTDSAFTLVNKNNSIEYIFLNQNDEISNLGIEQIFLKLNNLNCVEYNNKEYTCDGLLDLFNCF